ncbi:hypothetical protein RJ639_019151 [Escallonia herrerae]|uniref:Uncharacterized protein n=1 Tax=Escallonia herrerae TaxID=1293975 RepID=A0AA89AJM9_9ASTE|nr:hypothetical protein RJ639_019151 [Escallonia herrerae]
MAVLCNKLVSPGITAFLALSLVLAVLAELHKLEHPTKADGSLSFLVVGDWGRRGTHNQTQVALQKLGSIAGKLLCTRHKFKPGRQPRCNTLLLKEIRIASDARTETQLLNISSSVSFSVPSFSLTRHELVALFA